MRPASSRNGRDRRPRATRPCRWSAAAAGRSRRTAGRSTPRSRPTSPAASRRRPTARHACGSGRRRAGAAAGRAHDRRHPVGQGRVVGLVCGRVEAGAGRRHAAGQRQAQHHLHALGQLAQLPAAPPAVQLLRPLRARHAGSGAAPEGRRGVPAGHRCRHAAGGELLQAGRREHAAPRVHGHRHRRRAHRRRAGAPAPRPAVAGHAGDRHLRRERRLLGPRAAAHRPGLGRPLRARARASRPSWSGRP